MEKFLSINTPPNVLACTNLRRKTCASKWNLTVTKPTPADFTICNTNSNGPVAFPLFNSSCYWLTLRRAPTGNILVTRKDFHVFHGLCLISANKTIVVPLDCTKRICDKVNSSALESVFHYSNFENSFPSYFWL